jgi:hypothetical protein
MRFPAACVEAGRCDARALAGGVRPPDLRSVPRRPRTDTIFDLASLTKVIATATLAMRAVDEGRLALDEPVAGRLRSWRGTDREAVTIRDLLAHCAGSPPTSRSIATPPDGPSSRRRSPRCRSSTRRAREPSTAIWDSSCSGSCSRMRARRSPPSGARRAPSTRTPSSPHSSGAWRRTSRRAARLHPAARLAQPLRADRRRTLARPRAAGRGARRELLGARRDRRSCGALRYRRAPSAPSPAPCSEPSPASGSWPIRRRCAPSPPGARCPEARVRSPGTRCCRPRRAAVDSPPRRSGTPASPGRPSGSIPEQNLYVVLLTNRVHPTRENDAIREVRPRVHDAIVAAL